MEQLQTKRPRNDRTCQSSYIIDGAILRCGLPEHGGGMHCDTTLAGEGIGLWWFAAMADTPAELTVTG